MRHARLLIPCVIAIMAFPLAACAEKIRSYDVSIDIHGDARVSVSEAIEYDFGQTKRRGIYREIPTTYTRADGRHFRMDIADIHVQNREGVPYEYSITENNEILRIDVGGDKPELMGAHTYQVSYTVTGSIIHWDDRDTFHWDIIGLDWQVPIIKSSAVVRLPEPVITKEITVECTTGYAGSTTECTHVYAMLPDGSSDVPFFGISQDTEIVGLSIEHNEMLGNERGMTLLLDIPKGIVAEYEAQEIEPLPRILFFLLILPGVFPLYSLYRVYAKGRNPNERGVIVRQYDAPRDVHPLLAAVVLHKRIANRDFVGQLVSLAVRGYIHILHFHEKQIFGKTSRYIYIRRDKDITDLSSHERVALEAIFDKKFSISKEEAKNLLKRDPDRSVDVSGELEGAVAIADTKKMRNKFASPLRVITAEAKKEAAKRGYFEEDITRAQSKELISVFLYFGVPLLVGGALTLIARFWFSDRYYGTWGGALVGSGIVLGIVFIVYGFLASHYLPKRTEKGIEVKKHLLGLRQYISVAEKERFDFHYDPKKNPQLIEQLLPYAIMFGLGERWVKHIDSVTASQKPAWYVSSSARPFNAASMSAMVSSLSSTTSASTGRSGSGAGSGAGGGGGGSR